MSETTSWLRHYQSDVDLYVIVRMLLDSILNMQKRKCKAIPVTGHGDP
jgi:hypothetical protein